MDLQPNGTATPITQPPQQPQPQQIRLEDITPEQALGVLWDALNKASKEGVFTIDESYVMKVAHNVVARIVAKK
jgi:hypothetical protein